MINIIWFAMLITGIITAIIKGNMEMITKATIEGAEQAVTVALGLTGIIAFWSGMMEIAKEAGLMNFLARLMSPIAKRLFPEIPSNHPAMGAILLSFSANLLGIGNACTPLGIKAMEELQKLNQQQETASNSMCTYVAITASSLTLIPSTVIAFRAANGSVNPTEIIGTTIFATTISTLAAILVDKVLRNFYY